MEFEWDSKKCAVNERKHNVPFQEAGTLSKQNRLLVVSHTNRGEKTRIISARLMDRKEKRIYEEG